MENNRPKKVLFVLNRNGLDEEEFRDIIDVILDTKYAIQNVKIEWFSILGAKPEQPHILMTLSDEEASEQLCEDGDIDITCEDGDYHFEITEAVGKEAKDFQDPFAIHVRGIPVDKTQEKLNEDLMNFFGKVARPKFIIFGKNWKERKEVILKFDDKDTASMIAKVALNCQFEGHDLICKFANKQNKK